MRSLWRVLLLASVLAFLAPAAATAEDPLNLSELQGNVVVLDFWASWCVPCRRSFPWLNKMHTKYAENGLVIVGINLDAQPSDAAAFLEKYPAAFQIHYDTDAVLATKFELQGMPSSVVIGRDGRIMARHVGFKVKRQDEYEAILVEALGENP